MWALLACVASNACGREATAPTDQDRMHINLPEAELGLTIGATAAIRVEIVRNGFSGQITLRAEGLPSGVNANDVIVAAGDAEATMTFLATEGALPGVNDVDIRAEADSAEASIRVLRLSIRPPGSFMLSAQPVVVVPGTSASTAVSVTRLGGFTGTVTLTLSSPVGLNASLQPTELTGQASTSFLTLVAESGLRPGAYFVRLTASSPGFPDEGLDLTVTVTGG